MAGTTDYGPAGEARLRAFVERITGGTITRFERQVRWRPAWFADVARGGETLRLHLRGDRQSDVMPFPELKREADIMSVLGEHGIRVPHIYGYCPDPPVIVMEAIDGVREMSEVDAAGCESMGREYIAQVVAMHRLPIGRFVDVGILPPDELVLAGLEAYWPLYVKTKRKPEPLIEFSLAWIRRNAPRHRTRPAFVQFDSGQFLHADGRITGLYDFEFAMIGDPMADLATMRTRESYEPLGAPLASLIGYYEEISGEPVDHDAIAFHTLLFSTLALMQIAGAVAAPQPGGPHAVYLEWDVSLRQVLMLCLEETLRIPLPPAPAPSAEVDTVSTGLIRMLDDAVRRIGATTEMQTSQKQAAVDLIECLTRMDRMGGGQQRQSLDEVGALLGRTFASWDQAEAALEAFVQTAGADWDERLMRLFATLEARRMALYGPTAVGGSARKVFLAPTR